MPEGAWTGTLMIAPGWALFAGVPGESTRHAHHALQLCVAGAGALAVETRAGSVHRTEAIALPSGATHAIHAGGPVAFLYLEPDGREGRALSAALAAEGGGAPRRGGLAAVQRGLVRSAASRAAEPGAEPARALRDAVLALWLAPADVDAGRVPDARVDSVCRRVRERIGESRLGAAELAREVGLSPSRLAALFRAHAGIALRLAAASVAALPLVTAAFGSAGGGPWPRSWPFAVQVAGAILVFDLGVTFAHYASHRIAWLWRFHAVHHSVRRMYGLNGLLKHPVHQAIEMAAGTVPLLALGLPLDVAKALAFCTALQLLLQHSNVDSALGPLRRILAGAELHRFHHRKEAGIGDVNFGLFTTLGDRLLGTLHDDPGARLGSADLGIGDEPEYPVRYAAQLVRPFRLARRAAPPRAAADPADPRSQARAPAS